MRIRLFNSIIGLRFGFAAVVIFGCLYACASASSESGAGKIESTSESLRISVGFSSAEINPEDHAVIAVLNDILAADLKLARKLSGKAAVFQGTTQLTRKEIRAKFDELERIDFIRYIEFDQRRHIHNE